MDEDELEGDLGSEGLSPNFCPICGIGTNDPCVHLTLTVFDESITDCYCCPVEISQHLEAEIDFTLLLDSIYRSLSSLKSMSAYNSARAHIDQWVWPDSAMAGLAESFILPASSLEEEEEEDSCKDDPEEVDSEDSQRTEEEDAIKEYLRNLVLHQEAAAQSTSFDQWCGCGPNSYNISGDNYWSVESRKLTDRLAAKLQCHDESVRGCLTSISPL